jgi:hypothetical protein
MDRKIERDDFIQTALNAAQIATLDELKIIGNTPSTMSIHRALSRLGYLTSYSHRGKYYTLCSIPEFDSKGLWSCRNVYFSRFGNLLKTCEAFVDHSENGYTASELEFLLQVEVNHPLLHLVNQKRIVRAKMQNEFVYMSQDKGKHRQQELMRSEAIMYRSVGAGYKIDALPDEMKAAVILFFSLLDEKQRRLYAGLESSKLGHGGDRIIAEVLNLDPHTVAKGRREIFSDGVNRERIRESGGGRKRLEKKRLK